MMKTIVGIAIGILLLWFFWRILSRPGNVVGAAADDEALNAAKSEARETVETFLSVLRSPQPNQTDLTVKKSFPLPENASEHLWINNLTYDGTLIHGHIANDPIHLESVKIGDKVSVSPKEVTDWKYLEHGKLVGGYTIRIFYDRMDNKQKKQFLDSLGFKIE